MSANKKAFLIESVFLLVDISGKFNIKRKGMITTMNEKSEKNQNVPIWQKYMLTVDEATQYFGIGEKKIRNLISENVDTDFCFTVQIGNKSLINRRKFEDFLNQITSL